MGAEFEILGDRDCRDAVGIYLFGTQICGVTEDPETDRSARLQARELNLDFLTAKSLFRRDDLVLKIFLEIRLLRLKSFSGGFGGGLGGWLNSGLSGGAIRSIIRGRRGGIIRRSRGYLWFDSLNRWFSGIERDRGSRASHSGDEHHCGNSRNSARPNALVS